MTFPNKNIGGCVPGIAGGVDASGPRAYGHIYFPAVFSRSIAHSASDDSGEKRHLQIHLRHTGSFSGPLSIFCGTSLNILRDYCLV